MEKSSFKNTKDIDDDYLMTFGKYKGYKLANVPADYLIWLYENNKVFGKLLYWIHKNLDILKMELANSKKGIK